MTIFITGAAGFIGSSFLRLVLSDSHNSQLLLKKVVVIDSFTYAGRQENLADCSTDGAVQIERVNICDLPGLTRVFDQYSPDSIIHFAAESHVDNSIASPGVFMQTNVIGTFNLLELSRHMLQRISKPHFRFVHVSTDEVFGQLGNEGYFSETTPYAPSSPYSASKAASDHLVRAWHHTYRVPTIVTNCSNNYGPRQFPEKLIPKTILNCMAERKIPVYGNGKNVRDWIHVEDHSYGVLLALTKGNPGSTYCFGGRSERTNIDVVKLICKLMDDYRPRKSGSSHSELIEFVEDRKGHDFRYAIDDSFAERELGFTRNYKNFEIGLAATIKWYLENQNWVKLIQESKGT